MRKQPISPVTDPLQFRAIGLVQGTYRPDSLDSFNTGVIHAVDGTELEAVLLGRVIPLVQRYVDLEQPHLWVCYPRNRDRDKTRLHLQVMGIWEPSLLDRTDNASQNAAPEDIETPDGYFSVRGELMFTNPSAQEVLIKIRQQPRMNTTKRARGFKLMLHGVVPPRALRHFLNLELKRQGQSLHVEHYDVIRPMTRGRIGRGQGGGRGKMPHSRRPMGRSSEQGFSMRPVRTRQSFLKRSNPEAEA